ncbi:aliphatic acid kinase short-chain [Lucifera butyrica]|uniref:Probable butyrate kinase n=1 Tax=Lucifera butyrica TaxID=1351585 RepID=A0A498R8E0_9FIRM|nr:butyrate kinase [Lucifera butyrica]VBB05408.1 aliphatic acid kinase short-chain [Lucifera butyrica]
MSYKILTINPGSTSTKVGIYEDIRELLTQNISHSAAEISRFPAVIDQYEYRLQQITDFLTRQGWTVSDFAAIVGRGGLLKPLISGTYRVNPAMLADLKTSRFGAHASNLGAMLAHALAQQAGCPAYIVDPVVVDELSPLARITGHPEISRRSIFHALNQKAVAKRFAASQHKRYDQLNLIVAHLGGGISVGCHQQGRVVEVNNALDGEGPFSPERAGTLPAGQWASYVLDKALPRDRIAKTLSGKAGLVAHLGVNDAREVEKRIAEGDQRAKEVYDAMIYAVARYIAAAAVPVCGRVDYILVTGGIAYSQYVTDKLKEYVSYLAPLIIIPGENELQALAEGAYRVLTGEEEAKEY